MKGRFSPILSVYIGRNFLMSFAGVFLILVGLIWLFDFIELVRRGASRPEVTTGIILQMSLLELPQMSTQMLPFGVLFGGIWAFWRLTRSNELIVARAAGVSVWQFLTPILLGALAIGMVRVMALSPLTSVLVSRYSEMESHYLKGSGSLMALSRNGPWMRQNSAAGQQVIHASRMASQGTQSLTLQNVTIFEFAGADRFLDRIDAASGVLDQGKWRLNEAMVTSPGKPKGEYRPVEYLPTDLTVGKIQDSFASPETMSFWELPSFIAMLRESGFSALNHRLYWHQLLAAPLLLCAMVLIAATFSLRPSRRGGVGIAIAGGLVVGFVLYFLSNVVFALGLSAAIPVALAAWTPAMITTLLGVATLLHLEDG